MVQAATKKRKNKKEHCLREFLIEAENKIAYDIATSLLEDNATRYNPLFFYGPENSGKTHLLWSVYKEIQKKYEDSFEILYLTAKEFHEKFAKAARHHEYSIFRDTYRDCKYLFIEDLEYLSNKIKTQQELVFTMNALQSKSYQIVFSSQLPLRLLNLEPLLLSRVCNGLSVSMQPLSKKAVMEYCKRVSCVYGVQGEEKAIEALWDHCGKSFGKFQKMFQHLLAILSKKKQSISLPLIERSIQACLKQTKVPTLDSMLRCVAEHYQVPLETLKEKNGKKSLAKAKTVAIFLARDFLQMSVAQIQEIFGNRSESSIRYIMDKVLLDSSLLSEQLEIRKKIAVLLDQTEVPENILEQKTTELLEDPAQTITS